MAGMAGMAADRPRDEFIHRALRRSAGSRPCGFFLDFDGVLAPIQVDPDAVSPVPGVTDQLATLSRLADKVAVISARPVQFLARHFGSVPSVELYGMYGLEIMSDGVVTTDSAAAEWIPVIGSVLRDAERDLPAGVAVEDKRLSVALHYRRHPERKDAVQAWSRAKAKELGLLEQSGRMVVELKPPVPVDKGTVLGAQISGLASAWYFGDDLSDAKAFDALRGRQREDPAFAGVCVAVRNTETGHSLEEQADFVLPGPKATAAVLALAVEVFGSGA